MFKNAELKIQRAEAHISELEREFQAFIERKPHRFRIKNDPQTGQPIVQIAFVEDLTTNLPLIIGDAIHNLYTALDHMTWETFGLTGGTQNKHLKFPTGGDVASFNGTCDGLPHPRQDIKNAFKGLEVYPGGSGEILYRLKEMDIADKHTVLTPVLRATEEPLFHIVGPDGTVFATIGGNTYIGGAGSEFNVTNVPPGCSIEIDKDATCKPKIFFSNGGGRVQKTLKQFAVAVDRTVRSFRNDIEALIS